MCVAVASAAQSVGCTPPSAGSQRPPHLLGQNLSFDKGPGWGSQRALWSVFCVIPSLWRMGGLLEILHGDVLPP